MADRTDDDLAAAAADLAASLEALRDDLAPRGPMGLPRPPRPAEVLRFAEGHAIPTAIAVLEANVRALELLRAALRLADPERSVTGEAGSRRAESAAARAGAVGRETLRRADAALGELLAAVEDGALPQDAEARGVVEDARRLREEIEARLAEAEARAEGSGAAAADDVPSTGGDVPSTPGEGTTDDADGSGVAIDVEAELESIKSEVGASEDAGDAGDEGETTDGEAPDDERAGDADASVDESADADGEPADADADADGTDAGPGDGEVV